MLRPTKHSHPDKTVIYLAMRLLLHIKNQRIEEYESLRAFAKREVESAEFLYLPALNFLFLLGLIEYHPKNDSFEYVGPNEALSIIQ